MGSSLTVVTARFLTAMWFRFNNALITHLDSGNFLWLNTDPATPIGAKVITSCAGELDDNTATPSALSGSVCGIIESSESSISPKSCAN